MATISNYFYLEDNLGYRNLGSLKIYLNRPLIEFKLYDDKQKNFIKHRLNYEYYLGSADDFTEYPTNTDFKGLTIYYNFQNGLSSPSTITNGATTTINPCLPVDTTLSSLTTPTNPEGYYNHQAARIYSNFLNYDVKIFDSVADPDQWILDIGAVYFVDNFFNSRKPEFTVLYPGTDSKYVEIKMTYKKNNYLDDLATLISTGDEIDTDDANQYLVYDSTSATYKLPWEEGVDRTYRLKTWVPANYGHSLSEVDTPEKGIQLTTTTFSSSQTASAIHFFNDELKFTTIQLNQSKNLSRNGNTLSWSGVSNARSYTIYVDGTEYETGITTTSWTIPDELYYDQFHNYSLSVDSYTKSTYQMMTATGKASSSASTATFPVLRKSTFTIYGGTTSQTSDYWSDVGQLNPPTYTYTRDKINQYTFTLSHTSLVSDTKFYYMNPNGTGDYEEIDGNQKTFGNLFPGYPNEYFFYVGATINGITYYSDGTAVNFSTNTYPVSRINSITKTGINSYSITFSNSSSFKPDRFDVYLNDIIYRADATSPLEITGWKANTSNKIKIVAVYEEDENYNSELVSTYGSQYTPILTAPTLSKKDIKENNVEQQFGDAGSKEILNNVTTKVELSWNAIQYASGYVLYDDYKIWNNDVQDWEEGQRTYPTQTTEEGTEYSSSTTYTIYMDNIQGYHTYSVEAIAASDEAYNSEISNEITLEQNFPLDAPQIEGDNDTTTISFDKVDNADFYSIQLIPTRGTTENLFRSFIPDEFPFIYNYYDMVKDLNETETFIVSVFARSYNAFYFHPSADSNKKSVEIIKLDKPVNVQYDDETGKLTWTGDSRAYQYEIKIKATDGDWATYYTTETEYLFDNLAPSLYTVYITAIRDDSLINNQPVYLDSEKSDNLSFGLLNIPQDFERNVNTFSWTSVGADRYVFYEDGKSLTTVDGGGVSLDLGMVSGAKYRPSEGTHTYNVQAVTTIDGVEYKSLLSETITVEIVYLKTLSPYYITDGESYIQWEELDSNVVYDTRVNNISEKDLTNENVYTMSEDEAGLYKFKVRSISTVDKFLYQTSEFSEEVLYSVFKLSRPEISLSITEDSDTGYDQYNFTWEIITNATNYEVIVNQDGEETSYIRSEGEFSFFPESGNYTVRVYALGSTASYPNPKYITSDSSNIIKFGKLEAPEISINENIISWEKNELADYYEIYNYGEYFSQTDDTSFVLDVSKPYSYNITVKAISNDELVMDSDASNSVEYVITQLGNPQNVKISGDTLSWDLVLNATSYRIFIDGVLTTITSQTSLNINNILSELAGVVKIYVTAISNKINFLESENSNYILKKIQKQKKYNIVIDGINYDKIQLPFEIHETLDETLDNAGLTLAYTDRKEPFPRLTPAAIIIYEGSASSRSYKMIVESDDVSEIQIGTQKKYKHTLQLIERTLILQNTYIPDFTVSNSVVNIITNKPGLVQASIGTNTIPGRNFLEDEDIIATGTYNNYTIDIKGPIGWILEQLGIESSFTIPLGFVFFTGLSDSVKGNIKDTYKVGEEIVLPMPASRLSCWNISIQEVFFEVIENLTTGALVDLIKAIIRAVKGEGTWRDVLLYFISPITGVVGSAIIEELYEGTLSDDDWPFPARKYYIRTHDSNYEKTSDEILIASDETSFSLSNKIHKISKEGNYDIILEIPAINFQDLNDKGMLGFYDDLFNSSNWGQEVLPTNVDFMKDADGNPTTFRMVWSDIQIVRDDSKPQAKSIAEVLEKITTLTLDKFTIDPVILSMTRNIPSPDFTFSGGNYLYDVLLKIGREFNGLPRLLENNVITFDILNEYTNYNLRASAWQDENVLQSRSQELDKVASGFVSQLTHLIPDDDYTIYPAPDMWVYAKGATDTMATVDISNISVIVDKPIYKFKKLLVKNAIKNNPEFIIDLTDYVYQDIVYDSLNDNAYGKGMALVWTQGDKQIRGIGQLPEVSKLYAVLEWSSDEYVIEHIIQHYIDLNLSTTVHEVYEVNNPNDMLFRVEYQGYTDTTIYLENSDRRDNKYTMYTMFNQEDNTISDSRFSNSALTQLKRHGGDIIQKTYKDYTIVAVPQLGAPIDVDGETYYLDELKYSFGNSYIDTYANFTKNYNKINPRMAVNSEYRQYELRDDNIVNRVINFNEYCYIGDEDSRNENTEFYNWGNVLQKNFIGDAIVKPDSFYFNCFNSLNLDKIPYMTTDENGKVVEETIEGIAKPLSLHKIGTSILFHTEMEDAFMAGKSIRRKDDNPKNQTMVQSYVRYAGDDSKDQLPYLKITIGSLPSFVKAGAEASYPSVKWLSQPEVSLNTTLVSKFIKVNKDQREKLGFNYQMHFISNRKDLFIHKGLTRYMFRNPSEDIKNLTPIFVAYSDFISNKDILDTQYEKIGDVSVSDQFLQIENKTLPENNYLGIALIWPDTKEIILEFKSPDIPDQIWFNFSKEILK